MLRERDILPAPLLSLSAFFEATRTYYYDGLRQVTERADWDTWVRYFLNGVARQSEDALSPAERINRLLETWRSTLAGKPNTRVALQMLDLLGSNPFITPRGAEARLGSAYNTVMRAIGLLREQGIVAAATEAKRDRIFCANTLLDILEEPARLTPVDLSRPALGPNVPQT